MPSLPPAGGAPGRPSTHQQKQPLVSRDVLAERTGCFFTKSPHMYFVLNNPINKPFCKKSSYIQTIRKDNILKYDVFSIVKSLKLFCIVKSKDF